MEDIKDSKWSNKKCIVIAYRDNFPSIVKDINIQKSIINRFLNFYLTGKHQKGLSITDLLFSVISIMPFSHEYTTDENYIWPNKHYSDDGTLFFLTPEDKLLHDIKMVVKNDKVKKEEECAAEEKLLQGDENTNNVSDNENEEFSFQKDIGESESHIETMKVDDNEVDTNTEQIDENPNQHDDDNKDRSDKYNTIFEKSQAIKWFRLKHPNVVPRLKNIQYGPVENAKFCISCNKLLDKWENVKARQVLKYFFGVTALVLMRAQMKAAHNLEEYFLTKFTSLIPSGISYSPPHKSCINKTWKMFRRFSTPEIQTMFAKLVINSFYIDTMRVNMDTVTINIFKASVLAHTSNYGMGLINMLQVIALHTQDMFYLAFESLLCDETRESWEHVKKFLDEYLSSTTECTHHWARLIDPEQFQELCCTNNIKLAVFMAVFIEKLTKSEEIWNSGWTKNRTLELVPIKSLGCKLYTKYEVQKSILWENNISDLLLCLQELC